MDYQDIIVSCKNCEIKVPMSKTKFDRLDQVLICLKCYKEIYGEHNEKIIQAADPNRLNYSCNYCGYKFSRNKGLNIDICPYCSKAGLKVEGIAMIKTPDKRLSDY